MVGNRRVFRHDSPPPWGHGSIRPRTSPSGSPRSTTSSPSSRNVRVEPSGSSIGSSPFQLSSIRLPRSERSGPEIVPGGEQVAGAEARAVHRQVRDLLGDRPVQVPRVRPRDHRPVQLDLQCDVVTPTAPRRDTAAAPAPAARPAPAGPRSSPIGTTHARSPTWRTTSRGTARAAGTPRPGCRGPTSRSRAPCRTRGRAPARSAPAPPSCSACRSRSRPRARCRAAGSGPNSGPGRCPLGRRTGVPLGTTVPARPW